MKTLKERLEARKLEYEKLITREYLIQAYLDKLTDIVPSSVYIHTNIYLGNAYIHLSFDSVESFEENFITPISEKLNVTWERTVDMYDIIHEARLIDKDEDYIILIIVRSRPTDSCQITKVATGKTRTVSKTIEVEVAEFEYLIECSDD